jgi:hypothetical protein
VSGLPSPELLLTITTTIKARKEPETMEPIQIPEERHDAGLLTFEEFCTLLRTPPRTARDWRRRGVGPRFWRFNGTGRLYATVAEIRRFLRLPGPESWEEQSDG